MNFISHLAIARKHSEEHAFWLGAMLPDLASMAGIRVFSAQEECAAGLSAGIVLHHRTDDCFHGAPEVVRLMASCARALADHGVARGPARAAAHVGVEMLLDGELGEDDGLVHAYGQAIALPLDEVFLGAATQGAKHALQPLLLRLQEHGFPYDYRDPAVVTRRILGMLAARPRLRIAADSAPLLTEVFTQQQPEVRRSARAIFEEVLGGLSARSPGHNEG